MVANRQELLEAQVDIQDWYEDFMQDIQIRHEKAMGELVSEAIESGILNEEDPFPWHYTNTGYYQWELEGLKHPYLRNRYLEEKNE